LRATGELFIYRTTKSDKSSDVPQYQHRQSKVQIFFDIPDDYSADLIVDDIRLSKPIEWGYYRRDELIKKTGMRGAQKFQIQQELSVTKVDNPSISVLTSERPYNGEWEFACDPTEEVW